jgi:putative RecB family exonuclease
MSVEPAAYSFSRITTFEQCARRFRYRYLDKVREAFDSVEGFMGRQVHESIEWLFAERLRGTVPSAAQAVARYCEQWDTAIVSGPRTVRVIRRDQDVAGYRRTGAELVARFHRDRFTSDALETVANEKYFEVDVGGRYRFCGYIDRLARDRDGRLYVIDYKTGKRAPQRFEGKEADQLYAYALAMFLETDCRELELVLEFLRAGTTLRARVSRDEAADIDARLAARIAIVEDATVFPPTPGALCDWCGYNDICDGYRPRIARGGAPA